MAGKAGAGIASAALTASGLACSSATALPGSQSASDIALEQTGNAVQTAKLPQSGPVIALSSADVWAAPDGNVLHWNGKEWAFAQLPEHSDGPINSFAAASPDDIWAVGMATGSHGAAPLVLHWNGKRWSHSYGTPQQSGDLYAVGVAGKDVWAVGSTSSGFFGPRSSCA